MRRSVVIAAVAAVLLVVPGTWAWAQNSGGVVYGMFGPRVIAGSLQPQPRTFAEGIVTAPSGQFIGRGRAQGMTFNPSLWQSAIGQQQQAELRRLQVQAAQTAIPTIPTTLPPPTSPPPEQWFRSPVTGAGAAMGGQPAAGGFVAPIAGAVVPAPVEAATPPATAIPMTVQRPIGLGFVAPAPENSPAASVARLIDRSPRIAKLSPITVTVAGETAILRGIVATMHDRALAEDLARLEPGIWDVQNELLVGSAAVSAR